MPPIRSTNTDKNEPIFVPIINNINYNNQPNSSVAIGKRLSSTSSCLTEKQKEKLRTRHVIPLLCDDNSNTQSNSCTIDTPTPATRITNHQLRNAYYGNQQSTTGLSLFTPFVSNPSEENNPTIESLPKSTEEIEKIDEDIPEESSISKKLRRSCRPSISARKSLTDSTRKKRAIPLSNELPPPPPPPTTAISSSIVTDTPTEQIRKHPVKGILKRLSPTKPRHDHTRRVVFHDQVKVLVFASPSRRDLLTQQKKKSPNRDETKSPTRIIPKENLPLRKQPMAARRLSAMNSSEQIIAPSPVNYNKTRSSKLFHPNDALADWTQNHHDICQVN
jgi:hypothetical protein